MNLDYEQSYNPGFLDESTFGGLGMFGLIMAILAIVGAWKLFAKAGVPGLAFDYSYCECCISC